MKPKRTLLTAYPTFEAGPGWANSPIWIIEQDITGALFIECLQPEQQTEEMQTLFTTCAAAHAALTRAVKRSRKHMYND